MATATSQASAAAGATRGTAVASDSASMEFLVVEDNGGNYYWTLMDRGGDSLARSPSFASYEYAEDAARVVLAGTGSARLERRAASDSSLDIRNKTNVALTANNGARGVGPRDFDRVKTSRGKSSPERRKSPRNT